MAATIGLVIFGFVSIVHSSHQSYNDFNSSYNPVKFFIPFFVAFIGMFVGMCVMMVWLTKVGKEVEEGIRKVCDDTSAIHRGISFHLREERYITGQGSNLRSSRAAYIEGAKLALSFAFLPSFFLILLLISHSSLCIK